MNDFQKVRSMDIRSVVRDSQWQILRRSFLGTWKKTPEKNVTMLRNYYDPENPYKTRIVLNYLTGTCFRSGNVSHPAITELLEEVRKNWYSKLSDEKRNPSLS